MKMNLLLMLFIGATLNIGCEKEDEFEVVTHEVYQISNLVKKGCFDYAENDTTGIIPIASQTTNATIIDGVGYVEFGIEAPCFATDSIDLKGNVLKFFIKPTITGNCRCTYSWNLELNILENKGLKILYYEYKDGAYKQNMEIYYLILRKYENN